MSNVRGPVCKDDKSQNICVEEPVKDCVCEPNGAQVCPQSCTTPPQPPTTPPPKKPVKKPASTAPAIPVVTLKPNPDPDVGEEDVYIPPPPPVDVIVVDAPPPYDPGVTPPPPPPPGTPPTVVPPVAPVVVAPPPKVSSGGVNPFKRLLRLLNWGVGGSGNLGSPGLQGPNSRRFSGAGRLSVELALPILRSLLIKTGVYVKLANDQVYGPGNPLDSAYQPSNAFALDAGGLLSVTACVHHFGFIGGIEVGTDGTRPFVGPLFCFNKRANNIQLTFSHQGASAEGSDGSPGRDPFWEAVGRITWIY